MLARAIREYSKTNRACFVTCFSRIASWLMDNSLACKPDCRVSEIMSSESQQRFNYLCDDSLFESIITILVAFFLHFVEFELTDLMLIVVYMIE